MASPADSSDGSIAASDRLRYRLRRDAAEHDQVGAQAVSGAGQRLRIGLVGEKAAPLAPGFVGRGLQLLQSGSGRCVKSVDVRRPRRASQARKCDRHELGEIVQHALGGVGDQPMCARRQDEQRDRNADHIAEADLDDPFQRGVDRIPGRGAEEQDQSRDGRDAKARTESSRQSERDERRKDGDRTPGFADVNQAERRERADCRTADRPHQPVHSRLERGPDTRLHDDDGGDRRPDGLRQVEDFGEEKRQQTGNRHADGQSELRFVPADPAADVKRSSSAAAMPASLARARDTLVSKVRQWADRRGSDLPPSALRRCACARTLRRVIGWHDRAAGIRTEGAGCAAP